jgi:probable glucuronoxylan glucuronosyltransferase IRX7
MARGCFALGLLVYSAVLLHFGSRLVVRRAQLRASAIPQATALPVLSTWRKPAAGRPMNIFVYTDLPAKFNEEIRRENRKCVSSMFAAEVAFHNFLLHSTVRTTDPAQADLFFVPVYSTCRFTAFAGGGPDPWDGRRTMQAAIDWLLTHHPELWLANKGRDHVFMATHDYATCFDYKRERATEPLSVVRNSIVLQTFGDKNSVCYDAKHQVVIPPFLPTQSTKGAVVLQANWKEFVTTGALGIAQKKNNVGTPLVARRRRDINCFFIGQLEWKDANGEIDEGYSGGIRQRIRKLHGADPWFMIKHVTREGAGGVEKSLYTDYLERSVFCLSPAGFAPWTKRFFEALIHGCIPVVIADTLVLPFEDQLDYSRLIVRVSQEELAQGLLKIRLQNISEETVVSMQRAIAAAKEAFLFRFPTDHPAAVGWVGDLRGGGGGGNAFDYILRALAAKKAWWVD